jgi:hypothetical protein
MYASLGWPLAAIVTDPDMYRGKCLGICESSFTPRRLRMIGLNCPEKDQALLGSDVRFARVDGKVVYTCVCHAACVDSNLRVVKSADYYVRGGEFPVEEVVANGEEGGERGGNGGRKDREFAAWVFLGTSALFLFILIAAAFGGERSR